MSSTKENGGIVAPTGTDECNVISGARGGREPQRL